MHDIVARYPALKVLAIVLAVAIALFVIALVVGASSVSTTGHG